MSSRVGVSEIHLIPFDLGYIFYDILSMDNTKNIKFTKAFISALKNTYKDNTDIEIVDNLSVELSNKKISNLVYTNNDLAENAICNAKLSQDLYCYILTNGIGFFILADIESKALINCDSKLSNYSKALAAIVQKRITQSTILNRYNSDDVFPCEEELMLQFRLKCWELVAEISSKFKIKPARKFSSNLNYKTQGLSYILTIYAINENEMTEKEINYLMYSAVPKQVTEKKNWQMVQDEISNHTNLHKESIVKSTKAKLHFSWSAVATVLPKYLNSFSDIFSSVELSTLIKAEMYVQSRWFIADNSMDNVNKSYKCKLAELQKIESLIEFYQAELENEISANMNTLYKQILEKVVETSAVKSLYKSVTSQINTQKKIKDAYDQDRKKRSRLIVNLFMAIFTASSLFKTVLDIIAKEFSVLNIVIFAGMLVLAIGTILFDYFNK